MKKQTAVEWLQEQLKKGVDFNPLDKNSYLNNVEKLFEQAIEMEKEQITDAHIEGQRVRDIILIHLFDEHPHTQWTTDQAEQYYNETYGSKGSDETKEGYICPVTKVQCDDECCVSAKDCHIQSSVGVLSDSSQTEISDEEIENYAMGYYDNNGAEYYVRLGAKWVREQLKNKQ